MPADLFSFAPLVSLLEPFSLSFAWTDLLLIAALVVLEAALSADNAVALAALVKDLPTPEQRGRALRWGIAGAYGFRILIVLLAAWLVEFDPIQLLGAVYLLWLSFQHFRASDEEDVNTSSNQRGFWQTLILVELTDLVFSFDSIAASIAVSRKVWVIIAGGILGITLMRYMASLFLRWLDIFTRLEDAAFTIIAVVGCRMLVEVLLPDVEIPEWMLLTAVLILFVWGFSKQIPPEPAESLGSLHPSAAQEPLQNAPAPPADHNGSSSSMPISATPLSSGVDPLIQVD